MPAGGLYLARHGQTAYNLERRFQGRLPVPLDATGRARASARLHVLLARALVACGQAEGARRHIAAAAAPPAR